MTIDAELVTRKLLLISADAARLRRVTEQGRDAFLRDEVLQAATERLLERVIGRMIDVNFHVLVEREQPPPADYHASFTKLADIGVLEREFAVRIARAAGLRNRLVHEYEEIDPAKVYDALVVALEDLPVYLTRLNALLK